MPYGHASILLLGDGSEATEPYNKYDEIRPHSIRSLQFDQKVRPLFFRPEKFDLFTATRRFSRHATLNSLIKQTLGSLDLPSMLDPRELYRTDGKRPDGVTMIPWGKGNQLVWDVTVVDVLAASRLNQGSSCNPGTTATEAEASKIEKYRKLIDNVYIFNWWPWKYRVL